MQYRVSIIYPDNAKISDTVDMFLSTSSQMTFSRVNTGTVGFFPATGSTQWLDKGTKVYMASFQGANLFNATLDDFTLTTMSGTGSCYVKSGPKIRLTWTRVS